jgi:hypothetical protein
MHSADGLATPIICTSHDPSLFYRNRNLSPTTPGEELANRIRILAEQYEPPFFVTVYGGLTWTVRARVQRGGVQWCAVPCVAEGDWY